MLSRSARFPLLVLFAWLFLYVTRPWHLGLYTDDWWNLVEPVHATAPFSLDRLHCFVGITATYGPRPVLGFLVFIISSLAGPSAFRLQLASIFLVLAAALSLRAWLIRLLEPSPHYTFAADLAVIFWLVLPWMLGVTAWPQATHNLFAQIMFTEAARLLLASGSLTAGRTVRFGALLTASCFTYEAFYFDMFAVLGFYAAYRIGPGRNKRTMLVLFSISAAAQAAAIAFNRYCAGLGGVAKTFSKQWQSGFRSNVQYLPDILGRSVGHPAAWWRLVEFFTACAVILLAIALVKGYEKPLCRRVPGLLALSLITFLISAFVYALAGYGFAPFGMESRTLLSASWSFTIAFFALSSCVAVRAPGFLRIALVLSALSLIAFLGAAQESQVKDWAEVWQQERRVLAVAPLEEIRQCPPESAILFVGPNMYKGITVFNAFWDLTTAVFSLSPLNEGRQPYKGLVYFYPTGQYIWTWDGSNLLMDLPGYWVQKFKAKHLYVWRVESLHLDAVQPGYRWPVSR